MPDTDLKPTPTVISKYSCPKCGAFFGLIKSDGSGPIFDRCVGSCGKHGEDGCPAARELSKFQPVLRPTGCGGSPPITSPGWDASPWQCNAIRSMEGDD